MDHYPGEEAGHLPIGTHFEALGGWETSPLFFLASFCSWGGSLHPGSYLLPVLSGYLRRHRS